MDPLKNEGILSQIFLMKPSKRPPKITPVGPQTFDGIGMHLVVTVPIVISGPLSVTVLNGLMLALGVIKRAIGVGFIGIEGTVRLGGFFDQGDDGCLLGIRTNFEPDLIALPTNQTNDGGTIGFHCAPPAPLVGPLTWGLGGIIVLSWSFMTAILVHFVHFKRLIPQFYSKPK
jgi:hypothetical protein